VIGVILGAQILTPPPPPAPSADPKDKKKKDDGEQYATPATSAKTLDRQAVDAMMDGKLPEALKIYRQLAAQKPKDPTYSSAVKVLEDKGIK
jgi:outer membrane protein assembly factor BamD (BamD/ComL family)